MTDTRAHRDPMSTDRWQRVQDVFVAAIECDVADRAQLLRSQCGDDPDLRREVESLLASHERPGLVDRLAPAIAPAAAWARTQVAGWKAARQRTGPGAGRLGRDGNHLQGARRPAGT
jgi:hypothetical protein